MTEQSIPFLEITKKISDTDKCDLYLFNGDIERGADLEFIDTVHQNKKHDICRLILITNGGSPDAAYKMARYVQRRYKKFDIIVPGLCKSAGTLVAMGCHELVFTPFGELGPLDVQMYKEDKLNTMSSGLNISEALQTLEGRAAENYLKIIGDIMKSSSGVVSFQTAAMASSDLITAMYAPIFGQIDPEDVGFRARSMKIAADYGKRLNSVSMNMKPHAIATLADFYPSHGFVIDMREAEGLFERVREATSDEVELIEAMGHTVRWPQTDRLIICLSAKAEEHHNATSKDGSDKANDGNREDSGGSAEEASSEAGGTGAELGVVGGASAKSVRAAQQSAKSADVRPIRSPG